MTATREFRDRCLRAVLSATIVLLGACKDKGVTDVPIDVSRVDVNVPALNLSVGETAQLTAIAKSASGTALTGRSVTWSSASTSIVSVNPSGQATGMGVGSTTLTASSGSATASVAVTVVAKPHIAISPADVIFNASVDGGSPAAQTVTITNSGGGTLAGLTAGNVQYQGAQPGWLNPTLSGPTTPAKLDLQAVNTGLAAGTYRATVPITASNADNTQNISVTLVVTQQYALTITGAGSGNGVVSGGGINCTITNGTASGTCNLALASGTTVTLTATGTGGHTFSIWGGACGGAGNCTLVMSQPRVVSAAFSPPGFPLTVFGSGNGNGTVVGAGINCAINAGVTSGTCQVTVAVGSSVTLVAAAPSGHVFAGWSGACTGTVPSCTLVMSGNQTVTAAFNVAPTYVLTITGTGSGTVAGGILNCTITNGVASGTCAATYNSGTVVNLAATPASGYAFTGWGNACSGSGGCSVVITANRTVTAAFNPAPPTVNTDPATGITTNSADIHGSVAQDGAPYTIWFEWGTSPTLSTFSATGSSGGPNAACPGTTTCLWGIGLSGLSSRVTYYFRIVAQNTAGVSRGPIRSFTTQ